MKFRILSLSLVTGAGLALITACGVTEPLKGGRKANPSTPSPLTGTRASVAQALALSDADMNAATPPAISDQDLAQHRADCAAIQAAQDAADLANEEAFENGGDYVEVLPTAPSLPSAVAATDLPSQCDLEARLDAVITSCGPLTEGQGASLLEQAASCGAGTTCHIVLGDGDFEGGLSLGCAFVEGLGSSTKIHGHLDFSAPSILSAVAVDDAYGAISATADLLVTGADLVGGYEGFDMAWEQDVDVAICASRIAAGYEGAGLSWASGQLTLAGDAISACYSAAGSSWGSRGLVVTKSAVMGSYEAVGIQNSVASAVIANTIAADFDAVSVFSFPQETFEDEDETDIYAPQSVGAIVTGNHVLSGALPEADAENEIVVENNN